MANYMMLWAGKIGHTHQVTQTHRSAEGRSLYTTEEVQRLEKNPSPVSFKHQQHSYRWSRETPPFCHNVGLWDVSKWQSDGGCFWALYFLI